MTSTFTTSTGGVAHGWVYTDGIERSLGALVVERPIPWANNVVIDLAGPTVETLVLVVYTTSTVEYNAWMTLRGGNGYFDWYDGDAVMQLQTVTGQDYFAGRFQNVKLEFKVLSI